MGSVQKRQTKTQSTNEKPSVVQNLPMEFLHRSGVQTSERLAPLGIMNAWITATLKPSVRYGSEGFKGVLN